MHLKIATHPSWYPDSAECSLYGFNRRKGCRMPGNGPEILDFLLQYLNITYEIVKLSPTINSGQLIDPTKNLWDGVLGGIQAGKYDTVATSYIINPVRYDSFDFTSPIAAMDAVFVVGPPQPDIVYSSLRIFTIFDPILSTAVLVTIAGLLFGLFAVQLFSTKRDESEIAQITANLKEPERQKFRRILGNASKEYSAAGKVLVLLFGAAVMLFIGLYEGCLLTFLLLPRKPMHMTENELLEQVSLKKLTFLIDENQFFTFGHWQMIRLSGEEKFRKYQAALQRNPPLFFDASKTSPVEIIANNPGKYVYLGDNSFAALFGEAACRMHLIEMERPETFQASLVFRKNSKLTRLFNSAIHKNFAFIQAINERYFKFKKSECSKRIDDKFNVPPLGLLTLLGSFCLLVVGLLFSLMYFFVEFCCARWRKQELRWRLRQTDSFRNNSAIV